MLVFSLVQLNGYGSFRYAGSASAVPDFLHYSYQLVRFARGVKVVATFQTIEGHADERGTREYNIALGVRRAEAVRSFFASSGINPDLVRTVSYGKERPVATCDDISRWSKNRRAQVVLSQ